MTAGEKSLRESAGWFDVSSRARIRARGEDRLRLLHALATNRIEGLEPGAGTRTFFLSSQGRIQADCRIYVAEDSVLLETDGRRRQTLLDYLESFIIMDDVALADETEQTAAVAVEGPEVAAIVKQALGVEPPTQAESHREGGPWRVHASTLTGQPGCWIGCDAAAKSDLTERLRAAGAGPATPDDVRTLRVENLRPQLDDDYFDSNIPQETQQLDWVSFSKGCYIGQEILERVRSQGRVNRLLVPVEVEADAVPETLVVQCDGRDAGELTSPIYSEPRRRAMGFWMARRAALEDAAALSVGGYPARTLEWEK